MLLTGIANPRPMQQYLARYLTAQEELRYPDHHNFSDSDLHQIANRLASLHGEENYIITTEKDAARLRSAALDEPVKTGPLLPAHTGTLHATQRHLVRYQDNRHDLQEPSDKTPPQIIGPNRFSSRT